MIEKPPQQICEGLIGLTIMAVEIDTDDEMIILTMDNGQEIEFTGDGLEMYVSHVLTDS
jgi:hypothetical protein